MTDQEPMLADPLGHSNLLGRPIRQDGLGTLGTSTQSLAERALSEGQFDLAARLAEYFRDEMTRINTALYTWLKVVLASRADVAGATGVAATVEPSAIVDSLAGYGPGDGDLAAVAAACAANDADTARARLELMRVRVAAVHDGLVWWIQRLLADLAARHGDDAVRHSVVRAYDELWGPRYAAWSDMDPTERLRISVEGMRGHLSGPRRRGDVGVAEEPDRFVMTLDPCGSCGVLRNGDPDSGRASCQPAGTTGPHQWAWYRVGLGWYASHSAIVMMWLQMVQGQPPMRPLENCDEQGPCVWYVYKDHRTARASDYEAMGFLPPS